MSLPTGTRVLHAPTRTLARSIGARCTPAHGETVTILATAGAFTRVRCTDGATLTVNTADLHVSPVAAGGCL